jgi:hypothetical protein
LKLLDEQVPIEALDIQDTLEYREHPIRILDRADKETRSMTIPMCKVSGATTLNEKPLGRKSQNFG